MTGFTNECLIIKLEMRVAFGFASIRINVKIEPIVARCAFELRVYTLFAIFIAKVTILS
jgi:hypothetical protein